MKKYVFTYALAREGLVLRSNDDVGVAKRTVLQKIRLWAGSKTGDFEKEKLGGPP